MANRPKYKLDTPEVTVAILGKAYVIDDQTGEILDWPEGEPRHMDRLVELALLADRSEKLWGDAAVGFKAAIRRLMDKTGVRSVRGSAGDAGLRPSGRDRVPGGPGFVQWLTDVEFPPEHYRDLLGIAQEFNAASFVALCTALGIEERDVGHVLIPRSGEYVHLTAAKPDAPEITRARSREADDLIGSREEV